MPATFSPQQWDVFAQTGDRTWEEAKKVIAQGHPPEAEGLIMLDFDGTIAPFGLLFDFPEPLDGVVDFAQMMKSKGYRIGIFTSRLNKEWLASVKQTAKQHEDYITEYNNRNNIPFDFITSDKFPCIQYFDDKATKVSNNWREIIPQWSDA